MNQPTPPAGGDNAGNVSPGAEGAGTAQAETPARGGTGAPPPVVYKFEPSTDSGWVKPGYALIVVCVVSLIILGILIAAVLQLQTPMMPGPNGAAATPVADPNAGTVAALAGAALAALSSLTAAYFGIKVASEQSAQVAAQANATASHALAVLGNSTSNGNPNPRDF